MPSFEIRPASASDIPRLMALDHSCLSDYVWQLELRRESGQVTASFREVRLPRSIEVKYPRNPASLADEWMRRDVTLVAIHDGYPVGYICAMEEHASAMAWVTDLVVAPAQRRKGAASALLDGDPGLGVGKRRPPPHPGNAVEESSLHSPCTEIRI